MKCFPCPKAGPKASRRTSALLFGIASAIAGCGEAHPTGVGGPATAPPGEAPVATVAPLGLKSVLIEGVPHVKQRPDFCGEACVEMAARKLGRRVNQNDVFAAAKIDPALGRGAVTKELADGARSLGFDVGEVWYRTMAADPVPGLDAQFERVHQDLARGVPSILCMHYDTRAGAPEHFRLVVGYDAATDEVVYQEPAEADGGYRRMARSTLYDLWPLKYEAASWLVVRIPLAPAAAIDPPKSPPGLSPADYAEHVLELKKKLPEGFSVRIEMPFVVIGDESPDRLAQHSQSTVRWAVDHLRSDFFDASPKEILDVWLFGDAASYESGVTRLTGEAPSTPYGFYSPSNKALLMNIATGGGTLVHEIVHPYVEADLPDAPSWVNEGLGSLFEQSGEREGHIVGFPNWRLKGLQKAIGRGSVPSFSTLAHTTSHEFYDEDPGTNYSEARYLMYYLQERGLLQKFYKELRKNLKDDPSGYKTLVSVLGDPDMAKFKADWEAWVAAIPAP